jgi:hypothetical protein
LEPVQISAADLDLLGKDILRLGGYAEGLFEYHDFGFDREVLRRHIMQSYDRIARLREGLRGNPLSLRPASMPEGSVWDEEALTWNYRQTLRFAAGATMVTQKYARWMRPEAVGRSIVAKVLHKCQAGILDDLIDRGEYSFIEAKDLYHHCFSSMIDLGFDVNAFRRKLAMIMRQEQLNLFDLVTNITASFNNLFCESPLGPDLFYELETVDERVILGQALTMFFKDPQFDLEKARRIAEGFYAPDDDVTWHEKIASYVSGATYYNLIDMAFLDHPLELRRMDNFLKGWYYYDMIILYLNNVVDIYQDLRSGIVNLSLVSMRESDVLSLNQAKGYNPRLTLEDFDRHYRRVAEMGGRAISLVTQDFDDADYYYPFITLMMPIVMMADWIGNRDDMIHRFLDYLAPSVRRAAEAASSAPDAGTEQLVAND